MNVYPQTCLSDLEFVRIVDWMVEKAYSEATIEHIRSQRIATEISVIRENLRDVAEYKSALESQVVSSLKPFFSLEEILNELRPANRVIPLEDILKIKASLDLHYQLALPLLDEENSENFPRLTKRVLEVLPMTEVVKMMERIIDESGEVRDDASPLLKKIRQSKVNVTAKIERSFANIIKKYQAADALLESPESFKNGRRVLAVKSEHKRQVGGIIHDQSSTGQTSYIEPQEIVMLNNELFDLESEERKEIWKILLELCNELRFHREEIALITDILVHVDFLRVKAEFAILIEGELPELVDGPNIHWVNVRHPLLKIKNDALGKPVIPSDVQLHGANRMMLISGPNAGGKSITLKTVGLLQLMVQYGMLPSCDSTSKVGVFHQVMVDIGDQQSIENDLSTYSSRLQKMVHMMEEADESSLILIDEFGSGTDPTTGGALAEAILRHLLFRKSWGVVTTHYSNLKVFAFKNKGIVNASMSFDTATISPTYQLSIGKPGSSFAFEIAQKMNVPDVVLKNARRRLGEKQVKVEDLLISIQAEKKSLEDKISALENRQGQLDKLIKNYEVLSGELEYKRKKLRLQAKEDRATREAEFNRQLENTIRELKEEKNLDKAKALSAEKKKEKKHLMHEMSNLQSDIIAHETVDQRPLKVGDHVKMKNGNVTGEVLEINGKKAQVNFGALKVETPLKDLRLVGAPVTVQPRKSVQTDIFDRTSNFKPKLDIRGLKMEEAGQIIQAYLDEAMVVGIDRLQIVHGKGNGVLRRVVRDKAREYRRFDGITHPAPEDGGDGVSFVHLKD